ncbi:FimV/HubP family polar landmark protein [Tolumonas auensis]|uniref:FimV/HubP family polar landmark protein n=1 Tax=Tolumonas auensis TaxID=43948 RepID=UPI002AA72924|nr:FimV/HubP family polar landmark protein [Tolumonas auensis]
MAAVLCSTAAIAADKADDFYIEIKKPDSSVQQQQTVKPATPSAGERLAQPYIPDRMDKSIITAESKIYGPVKTTDTSWSIANRIRMLHPGQGISTRKVMLALYRKNPHAFADGRLDSLLAGARLAIPSLNEIKTATNRAPAKQTASAETAKSTENSQTVQPETAEPAQVANVISSASTTVATVPAVSTSVSTTDTTVTAPAVSASVPTVDTAVTAPVLPVSGAVPVAPTELSLIDSKVSELVNGTEPKPIVTQPASSGVTTQPQVVNEDLVAYQTENKELKEQLQRLNTEIGSLQATVNEQKQLKEELASLQAKLKEQEQKPESVSPSSGTTEPIDILALPLNIQLLISLPLLAFLVVLSLWLRSRTKREVVVHEPPTAEPAILVADEPRIPVFIPHEPEQAVVSVAPAETPLSADVVSENYDDIFSATEKSEVTPDLPDEEPAIVVPEVEDQEFATILSDAELTDALETDLSFPATTPEPEVVAVENIELPDSELTSKPEMNDASLASLLNLNKVMSDPGLQMSDQVISEPDGWELSADDDASSAVLTATIGPGVNLKEVNNDSGRPWLRQFDSELFKTEKNANTQEYYVSIDELLAQAEQQEVGASVNPEMIQPNLDVGLDEFPDMLPKHDGIDIDDDGGVGAKLDLARAYLEIDDKANAKVLLLEVQAMGSSEQIKEAEKLLSRIV